MASECLINTLKVGFNSHTKYMTNHNQAFEQIRRYAMTQNNKKSYESLGAKVVTLLAAAALYLVAPVVMGLIVLVSGDQTGISWISDASFMQVAWTVFLLEALVLNITSFVDALKRY